MPGPPPSIGAVNSRATNRGQIMCYLQCCASAVDKRRSGSYRPATTHHGTRDQRVNRMKRNVRRRPSPPVEILASGDRGILAPQWIPDTRFGSWLLSTHAWRRHVIQVALADLLRLLGDRSREFPTVLDLGCGTGRALPLLDRLFRPRLLVGVDPDSAAIQRASHEAERCRCRVQLRVAVATSLGLDDTSVDMDFRHQTAYHYEDGCTGGAGGSGHAR